MSAIDNLLDPIEIPKVVDVRQKFETQHVSSVEAEVIGNLHETDVLSLLEKDQHVAIAVGSRGIAELPVIVRTLVSELKKIGTKPFIVPAMGSHGGATGHGQKEILEGLGITEVVIGAPIRASMETIKVGVSDLNLPVYMDKNAYDADATIVINRIHPHVSYRGDFESGLMKMVTIGLGKLKGANICHDLGFGVMHKNILDIGRKCILEANIIFGMAIIENGYHQVHTIQVLRSEEIEREEPRLLELAKKLEPCIYIQEIDVLIMDKIGKNFSGAGFDTNIIGRYGTPFISGGPNIKKMAILDVTDISYGNCMGIGLAEFSTKRLFDKFSFESTYPNSLTATVQNGIKIPMILKNDKQAVQAGIKTCNVSDKNRVRLVWIKNTLEIDKIKVSESLIEEIEFNKNLDIISDPYEIKFNEKGNAF